MRQIYNVISLRLSYCKRGVIHILQYVLQHHLHVPNQYYDRSKYIFLLFDP